MGKQSIQSTKEGPLSSVESRAECDSSEKKKNEASNAFPDPDIHPAPENPMHQDEPLPPRIVSTPNNEL